MRACVCARARVCVCVCVCVCVFFLGVTPRASTNKTIFVPSPHLSHPPLLFQTLLVSVVDGTNIRPLGHQENVIFIV